MFVRSLYTWGNYSHLRSHVAQIKRDLNESLLWNIPKNLLLRDHVKNVKNPLSDIMETLKIYANENGFDCVNLWVMLLSFVIVKSCSVLYLVSRARTLSTPRLSPKHPHSHNQKCILLTSLVFFHLVTLINAIDNHCHWSNENLDFHVSMHSSCFLKLYHWCS